MAACLPLTVRAAGARPQITARGHTGLSGAQPLLASRLAILNQLPLRDRISAPVRKQEGVEQAASYRRRRRQGGGEKEEEDRQAELKSTCPKSS